MSKHILTIIITAFVVAVMIVPMAQAAFPAEPIIPTGCVEKGAPNCGLREMVEVAVNISKLILGVLGSVTLLIFIYGGVVWLTAAGNTQRIEQGKKVFEGALIGLIIVLSSWLIIYFITAALTGAKPGERVKLFNDGGEPFQIPR